MQKLNVVLEQILKVKFWGCRNRKKLTSISGSLSPLLCFQWPETVEAIRIQTPDLQMCRLGLYPLKPMPHAKTKFHGLSIYFQTFSCPHDQQGNTKWLHFWFFFWKIAATKPSRKFGRIINYLRHIVNLECNGPMWWDDHQSTQQEGPHSTMDGILASHPAAPGSIPGIPKNFSWCWRG